MGGPPRRMHFIMRMRSEAESRGGKSENRIVRSMTSRWQHPALQEARLYGILDLGYVSEDNALAGRCEENARRRRSAAAIARQEPESSRNALAGTRPGTALWRASSSVYPE